MVNTFGKAKPQRGKSKTTNKHKKSVVSMIDEIIVNADIILEILDARFVEKTRQREIEDKILDREKILIRVLNKSDLVEKKKVYSDMELEELRPFVLFSAKERKGTLALKSIIKKEAKKIKKDAVNVGIIGYPNVGKSSITNILSGKSSAKVSAESGYTKGIQKIRLAQGIYLIDTPGIILEDENPLLSQHAIKHSKIGAVTWDKTKNPEMVVGNLVEEYPGVLEKHYGIDAGGDSEVLIEELGRKIAFLKKGNLVDETKTAKKILRDWQEGKIKQ